MRELVLHELEGEKVLGAVDVREDIGVARIERAAVGLAGVGRLDGEIPTLSVERGGAEETPCECAGDAAARLLGPYVAARIAQVGLDEVPDLIRGGQRFVVLVRSVHGVADYALAVDLHQADVDVGAQALHLRHAGLHEGLSVLGTVDRSVAKEFVAAADAGVTVRPAFEHARALSAEAVLEEGGVVRVVILVPGVGFDYV